MIELKLNEVLYLHCVSEKHVTTLCPIKNWALLKLRYLQK